MENKKNMILPKKTKKLVIVPKEIEIYKLSDKKVRVILLDTLRKLEEHTDRQLN